MRLYRFLILLTLSTLFGCQPHDSTKVETRYIESPADPTSPGISGARGILVSEEGAKDPNFPSILKVGLSLEKYDQTLAAEMRDAATIYNELDRDHTKRRKCQAISSTANSSPLRIRFAIGYEDFSPANAVSDLLEVGTLQAFLQLPCSGSFPLCGFTMVLKNSFRTILEKNQGGRKIVITITTSSVSTENDFNEKSDAQLSKSDYAATQFIAAFRTDDVIIYWGHGRDGGGPDFYPPYLTSDQHVNYPIYQKQKVGRNLLQVGLGLREARARYVGIFGCNTRPMVLPLSQIYPQVNFVGSVRAIDAHEMVRGSLAFAAGIINNDCRGQITNLLAAGRQSPPMGPAVYDLFGPSYKSKKTK